MPGPGGGSRGGGFGGGGSRGGGFGGGFGRGGGFHRRPPRHHFGFYHRPYGFGFFGGGLLGIILAPIIVILFALLFLGIYLYSTVTIIANGGQVVYDEEKFQDYAMSEYSKHFTDDTTHEDNVLITVLTSEDNSQYYCIAIVGDNLNYRVNEMFGGEGTEFARAIKGSVAENYKYSLDSNLALAMNKMTNNITNLGLDSSFQIDNDMSSKTDSKLVNYTSLTMTEKTVNDSLKSFTEETGIPAIIVVEAAENVFGKTMPTGSIVLLLALVALIIVCIVHIVKKVREKKARDKDFNTSSQSSQSSQSSNQNNTFGGGLDNDTFN